ncbi:MAG: tRNA (guanosine(46)-N7)-methyltransferase TrmB, partial [Proteobacteria bacterium]|nr:tRNA (guanosine(46)-N7)-methyltransferase TrmB [Pseudomonadota bacterium]
FCEIVLGMGFNASANPFVALVDTKPELILRGSRSGELSPESAGRLKSALTSFPDVYVEVGSGSGGHILEQARRNQQALFIGCELRFKRVYRTAEKAEEHSVRNLLVLQYDASRLECLFAPGSLAGIFVLFPDPWAKRRWHKHRILGEPFISAAARLLRPGGIFHYKTDHAQYFEETVKRFNTRKEFSLKCISRHLHAENTSPHNIESEFEKLFKSKQLPIHLLEMRRI